MTSVDSNFNFLCGRPHGAGPPPPIHMRPPEPDPLPLRVDVINGWPLITNFRTKAEMKNFRLENPSPIFACISVNNSQQTTCFGPLRHISLSISHTLGYLLLRTLAILVSVYIYIYIYIYIY